MFLILHKGRKGREEDNRQSFALYELLSRVFAHIRGDFGRRTITRILDLASLPAVPPPRLAPDFLAAKERKNLHENETLRTGFLTPD
jgi:hypothetical protein